MLAAPNMGIDLPLKLLIYEDKSNQCWCCFNDPLWLGARHGLDPSHFPALSSMRALLDSLSVALSRAE